MKERPILFSGFMVRAILAGTKTQTRRVIKPQPQRSNKTSQYAFYGYWGPDESFYPVDEPEFLELCPYGRPGDRLWVRSGWWHYTPPGTNPDNEHAWDEVTRLVRWRTDLTRTIADVTPDTTGPRWRRKPSIHMPRWASRITLEITNVRVERLQEISNDDALAEGINRPIDARYPVDEFRALWDSINAARGFGWDTSPWVWVVEFKRLPA